MAILRSAAAVAAGIAVFSLLLVGASASGNALLGAEPEWINRSVTTQVGWLLWNTVSMAAAGYVTALMARRAPSMHAIVMGGAQTLLTLGAMLTVADDVTPLWLWLGGIVTTIPAAWMGARLRLAA